MVIKTANLRFAAAASLDALEIAQPRIQSIGNHIAADDLALSALHDAALANLDSLTAILRALSEYKTDADRAFDDVEPIASRGV